MDISRWEMWIIGEGEWTSPVGRCGLLARGNGHLPLGDVDYWRGEGVYRCLRGYESRFMNDSTSSIFIVF